MRRGIIDSVMISWIKNARVNRLPRFMMLFLLLTPCWLSACGGGGGGSDTETGYQVTYDANGAENGSVPIDSLFYQQGASVTVLGNSGGLQKGGYTFAGWSESADGIGDSFIQGQVFVMGSNEVTLYARWTLNPTYNVTYDANGADSGDAPIDSTNYEQGATVTVLGNPTALQKDAYTFTGWCTEDDGSGDCYSQGQFFVMGSANVVIYAKWTLNPTYLVLYDSNGADSGDPPIDSTEYEQGASVTVLGNTGNLQRVGYTFAGWCTGDDGTGECHAQGQTMTMGDADVILYATWTLNPTYTVTYNGNGNTAGSVPVDSTHYEQGTTVTVLGNTGSLVRVQDGISMLFVGWNTQMDSGGTTYTAGQTFPMGNENVDLYAVWSVLRGTGPAGGLVFYDKGSYSDGWRYMEASPTGWSSVRWGATGTFIGATATEIGAGRANTAAIAAVLNSLGETGRAAQLCDDLVYNGYDDWFLPSMDEYTQIYVNLYQYGVGGFTHTYWTSSELNADYARKEEIYDHYQGANIKDLGFLVRAARAF